MRSGAERGSLGLMNNPNAKRGRPVSKNPHAERGRVVLLVVIALQLLYQAYEFHRFSVHYEGLTKLNQYVLEHCSDFRDQPQCQQPDGCPLVGTR